MAEWTPVPLLPYAFAREHGMVVLEHGGVGGASARLGVAGKPRPASLREARRAIGLPLHIEAMDRETLDRILSETYAMGAIDAGEIADQVDGGGLHDLLESIPKTADLLDADDEAPVIRLINGLIAEAVKLRASDIHVEPSENSLSVRFRIDGVLQEVVNLAGRIAPLLVSRIKVMARLDIAEKRLPQDGRLSLTIGGKALDLRVSTLPAQHGERVVMRLLDKSQGHLRLEQLGMDPRTLKALAAALAEPNGIVLVTGPTGSGKTTTLYGALSRLNDRTRNILTVEDPIEYALEGVGQTQVNPKVGMTFAAGLRAILRQDPDIVMVGEIRDAETAQIAVQASLTGHLVLSTVHTNSAVSAVTRLRDMGIDSFLLAPTLKAIVAQRLVRRLCESCKAPFTAGAAERALLGITDAALCTLHGPIGCADCKGTGYQGRFGVYEIVVIHDQLRAGIHDTLSEQDLTAMAFRDTETLAQCGFRLVQAGLTSVEEILRVVRQET
ncbi:MAG: type II secretion system ATPase GspE [Rhodospirillaceae bacterium]